MPYETLIGIIGIVAAFGIFGIALGYVDMIAGARAITAEEELALRSR
ncbi:hypothetical protein [Pelagibacterium sp.]